MRILLVIILTISANYSVADDACKRTQLSPKVNNLVRNVLSELTKARSGEGEFADHYSKFSNHLLFIEENKNNFTTEAIAYLLFFQIGGHSLKELQCEAVRRGNNIIPIIRKFKRCLPLTGLEPLPVFMTETISPRPDQVINNINNKLYCGPGE